MDIRSFVWVGELVLYRNRRVVIMDVDAPFVSILDGETQKRVHISDVEKIGDAVINTANN